MNTSLPMIAMAKKKAGHHPDRVGRKVKSIGNLWGWWCAYCGNPVGPGTSRKATVDHVIPTSQNGKTNAANEVLACNSCNQKKGDRSLLQFMLERCGVT